MEAFLNLSRAFRQGESLTATMGWSSHNSKARSCLAIFGGKGGVLACRIGFVPGCLGVK
jgi:hypothetical protein